MTRLLLTIAVAVMLVLAGCNGGGGGTPTAETTGAPTGTETPTDADTGTAAGGGVSTPQSATLDVSTYGPGSGGMDSVSSDLYPPGVDDAGVRNTSTLLRAHLRTVYTSTSETHVELVTTNHTRRVAHYDGAEGERLRFRNLTSDLQGVFWRDGGTVVEWNRSGAPAITYSEGDTPYYSGYGGLAQFRLLGVVILNQASLSVGGTTTVEDQRVLRLSIDDIEASSSRPFHPNIRDVSGYVLVTPSGVVREVSYEGTDAATGESLGLTMSLSNVGTTNVSRPEWTRGYPSLNVSMTDDGGLVTLRHQSGDPIPANTTIEVGTVIPYGNTTTAEPLEAGETLYMVPSGSFGNFSYTTNVGSRPSVTNASSLPGDTPSVLLGLDAADLMYGPPVQTGSGEDS